MAVFVIEVEYALVDLELRYSLPRLEREGRRFRIPLFNLHGTPPPLWPAV
jgi:hypothetical protein